MPKARIAAWGAVILAGTLMAGSLVLGVLDHDLTSAGSIPLVASFVVVGAIIASARPRQLVGWMFCFEGVVVAWLLCFQGYATLGLQVDPGSVPGADLAAWLGIWPIELTTCPIMISLLVFPHGSPMNRRWTAFAWLLVVISLVTTAMSFGWDVNVTQSYNFPEATFPFNLPGLAVAKSIYGLGQTIMVPGFIGVSAGLVLRYRRGGAVERAQIRWLAYACGLLAIGLIGPFFVKPTTAVIAFTILSPLIPISAGIAITRYHLYDIDRIISRTLAYAIVTAVLAGLYTGLVLLVSVVSPLTTDSPLVVAVSTLVIAAAFGPARRRVQAFVDRRFNRARYNATQTLEDLTARLRNEVDIASLSLDLISVVDQTFRPTTASLWLREKAS